MSDHEILLRWLSTAATRMSWDRRIRELGLIACTLVALLLFAEVLKTFGVTLPALSSIKPLFLIATAVVLALLIWLLAGATTLAEAAGVADSRADLKDELKSARWFGQLTARDPFIELLIRRAARTTQSLNVSRLFPLAVPRSALIALVLAVFTATLAWFSPRIALPVERNLVSGPLAAQAEQDQRLVDELTEMSAAAKAAKAEQPVSVWARLEKLTKEMLSGNDDGSVRRADSARDARLAAQFRRASESVRAAASPPDLAAARPSPEMKSAKTAQQIAAALEGIPNNEKDRPPEAPAKAEISPTVRTATQLRAATREERRKISGTPAQGEVTPNNRLRAISRAGAGMREVAYGEGEAAEAGSQTSVSGAATGDRTGRSQAGGSEGEHPNNSPTGEGDDQPVLGESTERLIAQLEKMSNERDDESKQQKSEEEFYAATQRQAARFEYEELIAAWRLQRETVIAPDATPLSYRDAVKQYFLSQHAREE